MSFYEFARILVSPLIRLIFGIHYTGGENLPKQGPVIICSNHRSNYDPVMIGAVLKRPLFFMAKAELFKIPVFRSLIKLLGAFPVRRGAGDKEAVKKAIQILKKGNVLAMFPEGRRLIEGGTPRQFKIGAALFSQRTGSMILPVAILSKGIVHPFHRNIIKIGKPLSAADLGMTDGNQDELKIASEKIRQAVISLMEG